MRILKFFWSILKKYREAERKSIMKFYESGDDQKPVIFFDSQEPVVFSVVLTMY